MSDPETIESEREGQVLDFSGKPSQFVSPSMLAEAIRNGWQISPERKKKYFKALDRAIADLPNITDAAKRATIAAQCARVLVAEQSAMLRDIHHTERLQHEDGILDLRQKRAEEGKPNDCIALVAAPVRELPLPDALRSARMRLLETGTN